MTNITKGIIAGLTFGILSIIPMFFLTFDDKTKAMTGSFINRFAIGFIIFNMDLPISGWTKGLFVGLILSLPDAIITGSYKPILGLGVIGGIICGLLSK
ncbi:MAG: hypothetical protein ABIW34_06570 [Ginsengibacter sp.]